MRDYKKIHFAGILAFTALIAFLPACGNSKKSGESLSRYLEEENTIMTEMKEKMAVAASGNASAAYLEAMIPHHESAIEMAGSYLKYGGNNTELKTVATEIINTQTEEIETMRELLKEIQAADVKDEVQEKKYLEKYETMMKEQEHPDHDTSSSQNVEHAFARGMIAHHRMAIDMSEAILEYSDHEEVRSLARAIIDAQKKEIEKMEKIKG